MNAEKYIKIMDTVIAQKIIDDFEANMPILTSADDWRDDAEKIMMYLAVLNYMKFYG